MNALRRFKGRALWGITALFLFAAISAAVGRWIVAAPSLVTRARQAYAKGDWIQATELSRRSLKTRESDADALRIYARASIRLNRDELGNRIYKDQLGAEQMQPEDYFLVGLTLLRLDRKETAFQIWEKAARDGADHSELLYHLTRLATSLERLDVATTATKRLTKQRGWEARGFLLLGEIQHLLENPTGAAEALRQGLNYDSTAQGAPFDSAHYRKLLARSLLQIAQPVQAEAEIATILDGAGTSRLNVDPEANWLLSRAYLQQKRIKDASAALTRAGPYSTSNRTTFEPSPYLGAARCTSCHSEISQTHQLTRHARTFHRGSELRELPLPNNPVTDPDNSKATHTIWRDQEKVQVETEAGSHLFKMVVDYAFGTPERYITMIGRGDDQRFRTMRLSYYRNATSSGWGRTSGDASDLNPVENIRGEPIDVRDGVVRCLYCHVTQSRNFRDPRPETTPGPEAADSGIGCERCHGPGGNHVTAINSDFGDQAIVNFGTAPAQTINARCGECHIVGSRAEIASAPDDPKYVRSSALTMTFSRCYIESGGGLSCLTCHDAHRPAEHATSFYDSKCLTCHSPERTGRTNTASEGGHAITQSAHRRTACPVNPTRNCIHCHMPKVPVADLHTSLTDHYIRAHGHSVLNAPAGDPQP